MRREIANLNSDLVKKYPDYVCRVTSDEGDIGKGHLSNFQDIEKDTPVILTSSQLLTTGVDAPTCKNVVLARVINSMVEFKQIIGRGTRLKEDYGKMFFNILDFTQSTRLFADPAFDGDPVAVDEDEIDDDGESTGEGTDEPQGGGEEPGTDEPGGDTGGGGGSTGGEGRTKYYFDGGNVEIAAHLVYELDADGNQLRVVKYSDYTADKVRTLYSDASELKKRWSVPSDRKEIIEALAERGIDFDELAEATNQPDADPFDLLCHLAFDAPLRTRRERAERLKATKKDFFEKYEGEARGILEVLLQKYTEFGTAQFLIPDVLEVPPISEMGNVIEIADRFGGVEKLRTAVEELQTLLYAA